MDWEAPRNEVASAPGAAARPLFQIDPREIALHALTCLPRAALAAACAFALLLAVYVAIPTRYAAKAVVVADPRIGSATEEATPNIARDSAALESLVEVATTDGFLIGVVRGQKLADDPEFASSAGEIAVVEKLRSRLTIERLGTTYVFEVAVKSREAARAAALANAVAEALVDHVRTERGALADAAAKRLADQVDELRAAVAASGKAAADYRARMGLVDAGRDANTAERSYSDLSRQVADAAGAMQAARSRLDEIARGSGAAGGALDAVGSPLLTTLRARQSDLRQQIAEMEGIYGDRHPQIRRLQDRLAETGQQLAGEGARLRAVAQADYDVARRRHEALAADLAAAKVSVAAVGTASADLTALELKAKADSDAYEAALARYQKALASGVSPELEMTVSSPAQPPLRPTKRTLGFVVPIAAVLSLPLGFFAALGLSLARRGVRSAAEVETLLGLPVVAVVPRGRLVPAG
ncbi:GumC family protein, partial [Oharaeibacter diazotrophicus]